METYIFSSVFAGVRIADCSPEAELLSSRYSSQSRDMCAAFILGDPKKDGGSSAGLGTPVNSSAFKSSHSFFDARLVYLWA